MSLESAREFLEKMRNDDAYAMQIVEAETREDRAVLVRGEGFQFDKDELDEAFSAYAASDSEELDDATLDQVAGGARVGSRSRGGVHFEKFRMGGSTATGASLGARWKCDTSGSETECVC